MDILQLIEELEDLIDNAGSVPLTKKSWWMQTR